jgi:flavin-dependent dehydrogenase
MTTERFVVRSGEILEKERSIPVADKGDVIVAGGGMAGVAAAIAAAGNSAKPCSSKYGFLGGVATAGLMYMAYTPFNTISGIAKEIFSVLLERGGAIDDVLLPFDPEQFKQIALDKAIEAGVDLLFNTWVADTITLGNEVKGVIIENKSGERALADVVIDGTGDGDVPRKPACPSSKRGRGRKDAAHDAVFSDQRN